MRSQWALAFQAVYFYVAGCTCIRSSKGRLSRKQREEITKKAEEGWGVEIVLGPGRGLSKAGKKRWEAAGKSWQREAVPKGKAEYEQYFPNFDVVWGARGRPPLPPEPARAPLCPPPPPPSPVIPLIQINKITALSTLRPHPPLPSPTPLPGLTNVNGASFEQLPPRTMAIVELPPQPPSRTILATSKTSEIQMVRIISPTAEKRVFILELRGPEIENLVLENQATMSVYPREVPPPPPNRAILETLNAPKVPLMRTGSRTVEKRELTLEVRGLKIENMGFENQIPMPVYASRAMRYTWGGGSSPQPPTPTVVECALGQGEGLKVGVWRRGRRGSAIELWEVSEEREWREAVWKGKRMWKGIMKGC